jgi:hypothetical protein
MLFTCEIEPTRSVSVDSLARVIASLMPRGDEELLSPEGCIYTRYFPLTIYARERKLRQGMCWWPTRSMWIDRESIAYGAFSIGRSHMA